MYKRGVSITRDRSASFGVAERRRFRQRFELLEPIEPAFPEQQGELLVLLGIRNDDRIDHTVPWVGRETSPSQRRSIVFEQDVDVTGRRANHQRKFLPFAHRGGGGTQVASQLAHLTAGVLLKALDAGGARRGVIFRKRLHDRDGQTVLVLTVTEAGEMLDHAETYAQPVLAIRQRKARLMIAVCAVPEARVQHGLQGRLMGRRTLAGWGARRAWGGRSGWRRDDHVFGGRLGGRGT